MVFSLCLCKLKPNQIQTCFGLLIMVAFAVTECSCQHGFAASCLCGHVDRTWDWSSLFCLDSISEPSGGMKRKESQPGES